MYIFKYVYAPTVLGQRYRSVYDSSQWEFRDPFGLWLDSNTPRAVMSFVLALERPLLVRVTAMGNFEDCVSLQLSGRPDAVLLAAGSEQLLDPAVALPAGNIQLTFVARATRVCNSDSVYLQGIRLDPV